jgi:hypothetical protein
MWEPVTRSRSTAIPATGNLSTFSVAYFVQECGPHDGTLYFRMAEPRLTRALAALQTHRSRTPGSLRLRDRTEKAAKPSRSGATVAELPEDSNLATSLRARVD